MDLVDHLYDPASTGLGPDHLAGTNRPKARSRLLARLRTQPLPGHRIPAAAMALAHVTMPAEELSALCADPAVPPLSRAAPAYLLLSANLDPRVPAARLPVLAESLLLGCAAIGAMSEVGPVIAALCAAASVDVDALLARLEPWRLPAVAPGDLVYGAALRSPACAASHARILAVLERDPDVDAVVLAAADAGSLDPALAAAFLAREVSPLLEPDGKAWLGAPCSGCGGQEVLASVRLGGYGVILDLHLSPTAAEETVLIPLATPSYVALADAERAEDDPLIEVALASVVNSSLVLKGGTEDDRRALWLLRRLRAGAVPFEVAADQMISQDLDLVRALTLGLRTDPESLDRTLDILFDGFVEGAFDGPTDPAWSALLAAAVDTLDGLPLAWGAPVPEPLTWAGSQLVEAARDAGEWPPILTDERLDRLLWRELLAWVASEDPESAEDVVGDHPDTFERLARTPRDVATALGAPEEVALQVAEALEIGVDEPLR